MRTRGASEDAHRLAALHEQRLVPFERAQRGDDRVERRPVARRLARAAVDHEILRPFGDRRIEVVHQHAQRRLLHPALAGEPRAGRRPDGLVDVSHR
jgi:hypothetical protein